MNDIIEIYKWLWRSLPSGILVILTLVLSILGLFADWVANRTELE